MNNNIEIFKETNIGMLFMSEVEEIQNTVGTDYRFFDDRANGIVAFALGNGMTREDADNLVDRLNRVLETENEFIDSWFLGDENEEYVFMN